MEAQRLLQQRERGQRKIRRMQQHKMDPCQVAHGVSEHSPGIDGRGRCVAGSMRRSHDMAPKPMQRNATQNTSKQHEVREETIEHHFHAGHAGARACLPFQHDAIAWWLPPSSAEPAHRGSNNTHNERGSERTT